MRSAIKETTQPSLPEASENFTKFAFVAAKAVFANKKVDFVNYKTPEFGRFCIRKTFFEHAKLRTNCAQFPML